ncbi:sec signal-containing phage protein [Burkholderia phage BcepIL02]|uniref:Sec signal-containing phage protein n=1 Tax=Burkholderia phage BcepIL02 TaxID=2886898 RepID=C5IHN2_9CAUD|nr:sec signal-containing phage protein [Burkholderia phage BcepIL02]ACR15033.1 sec signal-containing phage protein [Burkholderia phage BcepIL02]
MKTVLACIGGTIVALYVAAVVFGPGHFYLHYGDAPMTCTPVDAEPAAQKPVRVIETHAATRRAAA